MFRMPARGERERERQTVEVAGGSAVAHMLPGDCRSIFGPTCLHVTFVIVFLIGVISFMLKRKPRSQTTKHARTAGKDQSQTHLLGIRQSYSPGSVDT